MQFIQTLDEFKSNLAYILRLIQKRDKYLKILKFEEKWLFCLI